MWRIAAVLVGRADADTVRGGQADGLVALTAVGLVQFGLGDLRETLQWPPRPSSSWWVPVSTRRPPSRTRIWSAPRIVLSRWAMMIWVHRCSARLACTRRSVSASRWLVARGWARVRTPV